MTVAAHSAHLSWRRAVNVEPLVRALLVATAAMVLLLVGLALAAKIATPAGPPIRSQEPAVTTAQ
jgi:hypothetical protein